RSASTRARRAPAAATAPSTTARCVIRSRNRAAVPPANSAATTAPPAGGSGHRLRAAVCCERSAAELDRPHPPAMTAASMRLTGGLAVAGLALTAAVALAQPTADEPEAAPPARHARPPVAARTAPPSPQAAEDRALLRQLADAQRALGEQIQQLRERV